MLSIGHKFNKSVLHDVFTGTCLGCNLFTIIMSYGGKGLDESVTQNLVQSVWWSACFQALVPWPRSRTNNTWRAKWLGRRYHAVVLHTDGYTRGKWSTRQPAKICQVVVLQVERLQRRGFHVVHKVLHKEEKNNSVNLRSDPLSKCNPDAILVGNSCGFKFQAKVWSALTSDHYINSHLFNNTQSIWILKLEVNFKDVTEFTLA